MGPPPPTALPLRPQGGALGGALGGTCTPLKSQKSLTGVRAHPRTPSRKNTVFTLVSLALPKQCGCSFFVLSRVNPGPCPGWCRFSHLGRAGCRYTEVTSPLLPHRVYRQHTSPSGCGSIVSFFESRLNVKCNFELSILPVNS